jgi:hypothetical protein
MMIERFVLDVRAMAFCAFVAGCVVVGPAGAQANQTDQPSRAQGNDATRSAAAAAAKRNVTSQRQVKMTVKAKEYYLAAWGVDNLKVSYTQSGNLIRFSYRVADPARAKPLGDKAATPYLLGQRSRALLQVPVMDKVGPLRQSAKPLAGQEYWMVFSNKGNLIKPGDRVNVMIGAFRADGLMVE